jgi:chemotaxis protein MotC
VRWLRLLLALAPLVSPALAGEHGPKVAPPTPIVGPPTPFSDMMLDVQRLQARMAKGDRPAYEEQRARMRAIGAAIAAAGPQAFKVKAERDAVIVYLLSGGQPRDIAKIMERGDFPPAERDLLRGAAGYTAGRESEAEKLLPYDAKAESLRLGSQLAYAQSALLTPKDARKALDLLDLARLLAPGTLIEEAALRREILLVGNLRKPERVAFLARQYVERFGKSLYASDFVHTLSAAAVRFDLCATLTDLGKFSALLELVSPDQARAFLLSVSRASALLGRFDVAAAAAERALKTATPGSADEARARLYGLASRFPHMAEGEAKAAFAGIATNKLSPADRDLYAAASFVDARLLDPPPLSAYEDNWREASVAAARSPDLPPGNPDPATTTIRRALAALAAGEAIGAKETAP